MLTHIDAGQYGAFAADNSRRRIGLRHEFARIHRMNEPLITTGSRPSRLPASDAHAFVISAGVAVIGLVGFAGWFANGDTLFWSLLQAGLAWCL
jgi:hypothetical protein